MEHNEKLRLARVRVAAQFRAMGGDPQDAREESILIEQGQYVGHRFRQGTLQAVWRVDETVVKFDDGNRCCRLPLLDEQCALPKAA